MSSIKTLQQMCVIFLVLLGISFGQKPDRVGTTAANFLEIGIGSAGVSLGDANTASINDLSAIYWNPAGLAQMENNEVLFVYQPWIADISTVFAGVGLVIPDVGNLGISIFGLNYGDIEVTNMDSQEGTGEKYSAADYAISLSFSRMIVSWFSFGATAKYISSKIWHSEANAFALDLGVQVQTHFMSYSGQRQDGLKLGMSISNYGTRMQYDGHDLLFPVDIDPDGNGNFQNQQGQYKMGQWELPLIFRVGVAVDPLVFENQRLTLAVDALHPNNMGESINMGAQYKINSPGTGEFFLRAGYKALFLDDSQYGATFGLGVKLWMAGSNAVKVDYAFQSLDSFGAIHSTSVGFVF
ncbi:MAG: PorV/PorQ family protein [Calditrichae bacterium]|nr:PorV/PorQ family protein [Calditrichota bacterium]MCB9057826.1 PorV/PorQ family protein [Calditrichia bacterium]